MSDVRLTATNPADSSVVPVACNQRGELLTVPPVIEQIDNDVTIKGDFRVNPSGVGFEIKNGESAHMVSIAETNVAGNSQTQGAFFSFSTYANYSVPVVGLNSLFGSGGISTTRYAAAFSTSATSNTNVSASDVLCGYYSNIQINANIGSGGAFSVYANGTAPNFFNGEVIISSRNKNWTLVEQGGLCHLVEYQNPYSVEDVEPVEEQKYPNLRNVFSELDLIEKALSDVMEKLRLNPPAGWPVWDGSNETA
jgi:hypothetical protein